MTKTKKITRTKRSAAAPLAPADVEFPPGCISEIDAAKILGVTPGTLRNYRYRTTHKLPGEKGPRWFEGSRRVCYQESDVLAYRDRTQQWMPKGGTSTSGTTGRKPRKF